jgi:MFS family permease
MAMYGSLSFLPLFVQGVKGTNAMLAGSVLVPMTISWVACSIIGSRMLLKVGYRLLVMVGMVALSAGFAILVRLDATVNSWTVIYASMLLLGMGMGLSMVTMLIAVQNSVPREQLGIATSATQFFRIIGGAIGVAVMGSVMAVRLQSHLAHWGQLASRETTAGQLAYLSQHPDVLVDPMQRAHLPPNMLVILRGALADALHQVFIIGLAMAVIALATAFLVPGGKAQEHALQPTKHPEDTEGGAEDRR